MVVRIASGERFRLPVARAPIDPQRKGHQNSLFRQMLKDFEPPAWGREVVVVADAGSPANPTLKRIKARGGTYVFALPRPRNFPNGKDVRDLVPHLPKSLSHRRATTTPDGRRQDYWGCTRHAELHQRGDVTRVLSKQRRNFGPHRVTIIVPHLLHASASVMLRRYAMRWGVELTIQELQSGLHWGRMQVTHEIDRGTRSVVFPVCASLVLLHMDSGKDAGKDASHQEGRLFRLQQRFTEDMMQDQVYRVEQKWPRKLKKIKEAA